MAITSIDIDRALLHDAKELNSSAVCCSVSQTVSPSARTARES